IVDNGASLNGAAQINSYGADLTLTPSGDFSIRNFYSTKMSGPTSLMTEENQYFSRLASAASCTISSSQLILFDAYGTQILSFNPGI
ncbi:MAG: META domain-containing protein, partial [Methanocorpusculum sp.]|nr:META domain-containing protein [Methanocorpusculum sp.]